MNLWKRSDAMERSANDAVDSDERRWMLNSNSSSSNWKHELLLGWSTNGSAVDQRYHSLLVATRVIVAHDLNIDLTADMQMIFIPITQMPIICGYTL